MPEDENLPGTDGVTIHLHGDLYAMLEQLTIWQGLSLTDAVRKAVSEAFFVQRCLRSSKTVLIEDGDKLYRLQHSLPSIEVW